MILCIVSRHIAISMGRSDVITLQHQCCNQICQYGVALTEYALQQLPVHMAPALLVAAINAQKHDVASCVVSSWPLPMLRYIHYVHCELETNAFYITYFDNLPQLSQILTDFQNFCTAGKRMKFVAKLYNITHLTFCLLYTSPSPRDRTRSRMPSSA